jgi:hypothetical protein
MAKNSGNFEACNIDFKKDYSLNAPLQTRRYRTEMATILARK